MIVPTTDRVAMNLFGGCAPVNTPKLYPGFPFVGNLLEKYHKY
jgi:hypothetical protein